MVSTSPAELTVRLATPDDLATLADIFNRSHRDYAGFVVRTSADIEWRCLRQPGMSDKGAFVVVGPDGSLQGYALIKENGKIIEFAVEPNGPQYHAAAALIAQCEAYALDCGASRVRVNVPTRHKAIERALSDAGLAPATPEAKHYVAATRPAELAQALASSSVYGGSGIARVIITNPLPWEDAEALVRYGDVATQGAATFEMRCDRQTINDLLLGAKSPWSALARRRLQIKPAREVFHAVSLLRQLRIEGPWFHTIGGVL